MDALIRLRVEMPAPPRDRLSALVRPVLIVPHLLLAGGPIIGLLGLGFYRTGALGALAWLVALFDWFAILFNGGPVEGLQPFKRLYLAWRARVLAYGAFLRDEYPPFGDRAYPAALHLPPDPDPARRDKLLVLLRPILVLPHFLVLSLLLLAWFIAALFVWLCLSIKGSMPDPLWRFSRDVMEYSLRVEAYALLIHDEFPSFPFGRRAAGPA